MTNRMNDVRIVSLLPGATETVAALGLLDKLVGRSHECDMPPEIAALPVCTSERIDSSAPSAEIDRSVRETIANALSLFEVDRELLAELAPTHVITQDQCDVCAVSLDEVRKALSELAGDEIDIISLQPARLGDIWADIRRIGTTLGPQAAAEAEACTRAITRRIAKIAMHSVALGHEADAPRVAMVEWLEPVMIAGNWVPEIVSIAGGESVLASLGAPSETVTVDAIAEADPDVVVFAPCGFALPRAAGEARQLLETPDWQGLRAVRDGRCYAADGNAHFNRPGPRLVQSVEIMAEILQPGEFDFGHQGMAWRQL